VVSFVVGATLRRVTSSSTTTTANEQDTTLELPRVNFGALSLPIHAQLMQCINLTRLNLADNNLRGEQLASVLALTNLRHLDLSGNEQLGAALANDDWLSLSNLVSLNLARCALSSLPTKLGWCLRGLRDVDVSHNAQLQALPHSLALLKELRTLSLRECVALEVPPVKVQRAGAKAVLTYFRENYYVDDFRYVKLLVLGTTAARLLFVW
jgi:Leucine-rich repeat (LRR) protein